MYFNEFLFLCFPLIFSDCFVKIGDLYEKILFILIFRTEQSLAQGKCSESTL